MPWIEDLGYAFLLHGGSAMGRHDRGEPRNTALIQVDWDYPSTAQDLGWSLSCVQKQLGGHVTVFKRRPKRGRGYCEHDGTDGTIACPSCGVSASDFIEAAGEYLHDHAR